MSRSTRLPAAGQRFSGSPAHLEGKSSRPGAKDPLARGRKAFQQLPRFQFAYLVCVLLLHDLWVSMLKVEPLQVDDVDALQAEIGSFIESVRTGGAAAVSAEEGYLAVEMAERVSEAISKSDWGGELQSHVPS